MKKENFIKTTILTYFTIFFVIVLMASQFVVPFNVNATNATSRVKIDAPFRTDEISHVETLHQNGWTTEFYRNLSYTCGWKGYQTFVFAYPEGDDLSYAKPLWIRMHGGGGGGFLPDGTYEPSEYHDPENNISSLDEETHGELAFLLSETGLMAKIIADESSFRFLMPSMCDHDLYSGIGNLDPYNPYNPDENKVDRRTDGLLATEAAFDFARNRAPTTHIFVHGTSAGSSGAATLTTELGRQGEHLSGAVLDSGVINPWTDAIAATGCNATFDDVNPLFDRIGFYAEVENQPHNAVGAGDILTPLFQVGSRDDPLPCGEDILTVTSEAGETITGTGAWIMHHLLSWAIDRFNPGNASIWRRLCVDDPVWGPSLCDRHSPTIYAYDSSLEHSGDLDRNGEDYNEVIYDWIKDRLTGNPS